MSSKEHKYFYKILWSDGQKWNNRTPPASWRTPRQRWSIVDAASWFRAAFHPTEQGISISWKHRWTPWNTEKFLDNISTTPPEDAREDVGCIYKTTTLITHHVKRHSGSTILEWPYSQPPDLNPIENLWKELKIGEKRPSILGDL